MALTIINARVLTLATPQQPASPPAAPLPAAPREGASSGSQTGSEEPRRGQAMRELGIIERGYVRVEDDRIAAVGSGDFAEQLDGEVIDAGGCVLMPAFVDCHTHACWAGDRFDEFEKLIAGVPYLDILASGGGIMSTVRAVRAATDSELLQQLLRRLAAMAALGTGTVEIKSGYGLNTETELKMLRTIHAATRQTQLLVVGTFLGAHALDPENPACVDQIINETLPAVVAEFPEITVDAYCETGAWSLADVKRLFEAARELGCPLRVHADQFNSLGATKLAIDMNALSVDHLEAITPEDVKLLAPSQTIAVLLPCSAFHLNAKYAPARELIESGAAIAIASNYNPGSAPTPSMPFTIALACRQLKMSPAEAITAATYNAACVLGLQGRVGSIEIGKRADLQLLDAQDERELAYEFAGPGPLVVVAHGEVVHLRAVGSEEA